jgi:hypothetical protein
MRIRDYYANPEVRARLIEFMGGRTLQEATCHYIGRARDTVKQGFEMRPPQELEAFLDNEWDVARSLWDRAWLVGDLDIEYANLDFPAEPFLDCPRTFALQEPVLRAAQRLFSSVGMEPLHAISGRGHHFVWKVAMPSAAFARLAEIGRLPPALQDMYATPQPPLGVPVDLTLGKAFAGLGLVMEYLARRIMTDSRDECLIPVVPEAVEMGPQQRGREIVAVDISEYGDPLHTRGVRMPFSIYLKPWQHDGVLTPEIESQVPVMVMVPVDGRDTAQVTPIMRDLGEAARWAGQMSCTIPDCTDGMAGLTTLYERSEVREFHEWFYSVEHEPPGRWPFTYDRMELDGLPPGVRRALQRPNDALLKPDCVRELVAALLERNWHPRHIAGLVRSKYERDYGWLNQWYVYDAGTRADFHTRVMMGLVQVNA